MPAQILDRLADASGAYDAIFCDVWGVAHNGIAIYEEAMQALASFRAGGGAVAMLTNAPRPHDAVDAQLRALGAPENAYDLIVTSGDATKAALASGAYGDACHYVGPDKDLGMFDGVATRRVALEAAQFIFCTGLFDDRAETPDDYADLIRAGVARGLPLLCANPDIVVDYGDRRLYCAGAIAQAYTAAGGESVYFGKPHPPIYAHAFARLAEIDRAAAPNRTLAIGDGVATDVLGARQAGLDCVFVAAGLASQEVLDDDGAVDSAALEAFLARHGEAPRYVLARLR